MTFWPVVEGLSKLTEEELIDLKMRAEKELAYVELQVRQLNEALAQKAHSQDRAQTLKLSVRS